MRILLFSVLALIVLVLPSTSEAAQLVPVQCVDPNNCGTCEFVQLVNNVVQFIITAASLIAVGVFMYAGVLMVTSGGNVEAVNKAKSYFTNVVIGYVLILAGFLIVDVFLATILPSNSSILNWREVQCIYPNRAVADLSRTGTGSSTLNFGASTGGGQCEAYTGGPCGEAALRSAGFGALAGDAARIIGAESSCDPSARSRTDTTTDGRSYSIGIWQINLAVHNLSCSGQTLNCPDAFEPAGTRNRYNVREYRIVNESLYNRCAVLAAQPACNHAKAAELANRSGDMGDWACSARKCGVATTRNHLCPL